MIFWLYDSRGQAIAFVQQKLVYDKTRRFLGELRGTQVWNGYYVGEIINSNRLVKKTPPPAGFVGTPSIPPNASIPPVPQIAGPQNLPYNYTDLI